ncbi:MAG TPA: class III extradiol ring-cleavage dioxygenase [Casimicrobiaceae bacterium]|nr:class III extradiol ring-cleavage dioxygenase [Casimicrobiaceae bacterium]
MPRFPTIFVSHGSPMTAIEPGAAGDAWRALAAALPRPRAVLIASAHWETGLPMLTGSAKPETIHDFGGFPQALYEIVYPAAGAPQVAAEATDVLKRAGITAAIDGCRGLDHGAWVPLRHMYPNAEIPVVQISVQPDRGAAHHIALGRALAPLAEKDVLVIGSGHVTHNLRDWSLNLRRASQLPYVTEFADWLADRLESNDDAALVGWREQGPNATRAHPSEEHFLPLLIAYGAAGERPRVERVHREVIGGALAMDAYRFGAATTHNHG